MRLFKVTIGCDGQAFTRELVICSTNDATAIGDVAQGVLDSRVAMPAAALDASHEMGGPGARLLGIEELSFYNFP
jgi:hypothetical protein